jgi:glycine/D-amino acid oxidase-like deaminating enzyme
MDPYMATWGLLQRLRKAGGRAHDRATVATIEPRSRDVLLATREGIAIRARHVVVAAGYEAQAWLPRRLARNRSSYALVTDPVPRDALGPLSRTLV